MGIDVRHGSAGGPMLRPHTHRHTPLSIHGIPRRVAAGLPSRALVEEGRMGYGRAGTCERARPAEGPAPGSLVRPGKHERGMLISDGVALDIRSLASRMLNRH